MPKLCWRLGYRWLRREHHRCVEHQGHFASVNHRLRPSRFIFTGKQVPHPADAVDGSQNWVSEHDRREPAGAQTGMSHVVVCSPLLELTLSEDLVPWRPP